MVRYTVITSEIVDRLLTAVPDDLRNSSSLEQSVKRWNRWIQALCRQVNRTCNCTTLNNMLTSTMLGVLLTPLPRAEFDPGLSVHGLLPLLDCRLPLLFA